MLKSLPVPGPLFRKRRLLGRDTRQAGTDTWLWPQLGGCCSGLASLVGTDLDTWPGERDFGQAVSMHGGLKYLAVSVESRIDATGQIGLVDHVSTWLDEKAALAALTGHCPGSE